MSSYRNVSTHHSPDWLPPSGQRELERPLHQRPLPWSLRNIAPYMISSACKMPSVSIMQCRMPGRYLLTKSISATDARQNPSVSTEPSGLSNRLTRKPSEAKSTSPDGLPCLPKKNADCQSPKWTACPDCFSLPEISQLSPVLFRTLVTFLAFCQKFIHGKCPTFIRTKCHLSKLAAPISRPETPTQLHFTLHIDTFDQYLIISSQYDK
jgi:hypothetical protein